MKNSHTERVLGGLEHAMNNNYAGNKMQMHTLHCLKQQINHTSNYEINSYSNPSR